MSRRSSRDRNANQNRHPGDDLDIETLAARQAIPRPIPSRSVNRLSTGLSDLRRWAPRQRSQPQRELPRDVTGRPARIVHKVTAPRVRRGPGGKPLASSRTFTARALNAAPAAFADVRKSYVCLRRKVRQQVLFARKLTRKGAGSPKKRNEWSDVRC